MGCIPMVQGPALLWLWPGTEEKSKVMNTQCTSPRLAASQASVCWRGSSSIIATMASKHLSTLKTQHRKQLSMFFKRNNVYLCGLFFLREASTEGEISLAVQHFLNKPQTVKNGKVKVPLIAFCQLEGSTTPCIQFSTFMTYAKIYIRWQSGCWWPRAVRSDAKEQWKKY